MPANQVKLEKPVAVDLNIELKNDSWEITNLLLTAQESGIKSVQDPEISVVTCFHDRQIQIGNEFMINLIAVIKGNAKVDFVRGHGEFPFMIGELSPQLLILPYNSLCVVNPLYSQPCTLLHCSVGGQHERLPAALVEPLNRIADGRGVGYYDIFGPAEKLGLPVNEWGQINATTTYHGIRRAWHWHEGQNDFLTVVAGNEIVAGWDRNNDEDSFVEVIGEDSPRGILVPAGFVHGLTPVGGLSGTMVYWVSKKYDPENLDEGRLSYEENHPELLEVQNK